MDSLGNVNSDSLADNSDGHWWVKMAAVVQAFRGLSDWCRFSDRNDQILTGNSPGRRTFSVSVERANKDAKSID